DVATASRAAASRLSMAERRTEAAGPARVELRTGSMLGRAEAPSGPGRPKPAGTIRPASTWLERRAEARAAVEGRETTVISGERAAARTPALTMAPAAGVLALSTRPMRTRAPEALGLKAKPMMRASRKGAPRPVMSRER